MQQRHYEVKTMSWHFDMRPLEMFVTKVTGCGGEGPIWELFDMYMLIRQERWNTHTLNPTYCSGCSVPLSCRRDCCGIQNLPDLLVVHSYFTTEYTTVWRRGWDIGRRQTVDQHLKYGVVVWQHQKTSFYVHTTSVTDSGAQVLALSLIGRG